MDSDAYNFDSLSVALEMECPLYPYCKWKKPDMGWIKLNTDGSKDRFAAGIGGLFRDHKGDVISVFVSRAPYEDDVFLIELKAIRRGLVLALDMGVKALWVESDSKSAVKTINKQQPYRRKVADGCLEEIQKLAARFDNCKFSHSWRETNQSADYLARMVFPKKHVVLSPEDFPEDLRNIIKGDADGKIYRRQ